MKKAWAFLETSTSRADPEYLRIIHTYKTSGGVNMIHSEINIIWVTGTESLLQKRVGNETTLEISNIRFKIPVLKFIRLLLI